MNPQVKQRQIERHCAASIRALAGHPRAEYRRQLLFEEGRGIRLYCPHLAIDVVNHPLDRCRGVADAMALRLVHTDLDLHQSLIPEDNIGRIVFDTLEQLRVESLAPQGLKGVQSNLEAAFSAWSDESRSQNNGMSIVENELGLLLYSVTQIARSKLTGQPQDEEVEGLIEATRFKLAPIIGHQIAKLRRSREDQIEYAEHALAIAGAISEIAETMSGELVESELKEMQGRLQLPRQHEQDDRYAYGGAASNHQATAEDQTTYDYPIFCKDYDKEVDGASLYRLAQRTTHRRQLDKLIAAQAVSVPRLAQRLKTLFAVNEKSGWNFGEEEGYLDGRRLSQLVANPAYTRIFKQHQTNPRCDTVVSFLIDNSGSMKRQRYEAVAIMVDIYSRALELAGIPSEILGFTTGSWTGGQSMKKFRAAGMPSHPGRLNDRLHIVYKNFETSWRRARDSIASLLNTNHYREGLDSEALQWATTRLNQRTETRKCLVMISDGAPMDSATAHYNDDLFLDRHLKHIAHQIETNRQIELRGIGIGLDMGEYLNESVALDLTGTLGNRVFSALDELFG